MFLSGSAGLYLLTFANRTQSYHTDESWHHAIALRLARGVFPPTTPYGPGAGMGYHYGHNLLASSIVNAAAVPAWTAMVVLESFFVVALILAGIGFARDRGGSLPVSLGAGAVLGLTPGTIRVGLPPYLEASGQSEGFSRFLEGLAPTDASLAFNWVHRPHFTLAVTIVILIAAAYGWTKHCQNGDRLVCDCRCISTREYFGDDLFERRSWTSRHSAIGLFTWTRKTDNGICSIGSRTIGRIGWRCSFRRTLQSRWERKHGAARI